MSHPEDNPVMAAAWSSFVQWAIRDSEIRDKFEESSGRKWTLPRNGLERMIDDATGASAAYVEDFAVWVTRELWGEPSGVPDKIQYKIHDWPADEHRGEGG